MKYLFFCLLLLASCTKDCREYYFSAWEETNGMVRISYFSPITGYSLYLGCSESELDSLTARDVLSNSIRGYGEYSVTRLCTPMYIRVKSTVADETIKI